MKKRKKRRGSSPERAAYLTDKRIIQNELNGVYTHLKKKPKEYLGIGK